MGKVRSDVQEWHWKETLYWEYDIQLLALDSNKGQHVQLLALNGWKRITTPNCLLWMKESKIDIQLQALNDNKDQRVQLLALNGWTRISTSNCWL